MANQGGWKNRITKITSRLKPSAKTAGKPANLSVELEKGAIKPPSVPLRNQINRAKTGLKNQLQGKQKSVDGVQNGANKTLGEPEEEALREQQGLPPRNTPENIPGGKAMKPARSVPTEPEENIPEDDDGDDELEEQQNRLGRPTSPPPETEEGPPPEQQGEDGTESGGAEDDPNIRKAVANRAIDYLKKTAKKWFSKEAKTAIVAFLLEYWWVILIAIVVIIMGFLLFNYLMGTASQAPSPTGQSMTQAYDPVKDRPTLQAVLQLSGDKAAQELSAWQFTLKLQNELESLKGDMNASGRPDKDQIIGKIDLILGDIQTYGIAKDGKTGKKIIDGIKELYEMFGTLPSIADAGSPLPKGSIVGYTNNFHDGTPMKPCPSGGCPKGHRTFYQTERNICDAVDLKAKNGTPVLAAFGGKVAKRGSDGNNGQLVFIENNAGYLAVYAHITNSSLALNETVKTGQQIGKVGSGHLHFELAKDGKCVTSIPQDKTNAKLNNKSVGYYLWLRMAKVLNNAV